MKEQDVKQLIDQSFRITLLLGYATSLLVDAYKDKTEYEKVKYHWFLMAIDSVIYCNEGLPPFTEGT
jgi:hypothetical protein